MRTLVMTILGDYWDSLIYKGKLYLFCLDGSILTLNWDKLIAGMHLEERLKLPLTCAFQRGSYLYGDRWSLFFEDPEVKALLQGKFDLLAAMPLTIEPKALGEFVAGQQANPFPFPHTDAVIHYERMYVGAQSGIFKAGCSGKTKLPVATRRRQLWDGPASGLSAKFQTLAIAAGEHGLYELGLFSDQDPSQIGDMHADTCSWAFYSIFGSSNDGDGWLAEYSQRYDYSRNVTREFKDVISSRKIFGERGYSWATEDKLCLVKGHTLTVVKYNPFATKEAADFQKFAVVESEVEENDIVSATVGTFGTIVELHDRLVVLQSDGNVYSIDEEPINWRVFPLSREYRNQLHVVLPGRLLIHSFNHDYFLDQTQKIYGVFCRPRLTAEDDW